jgi:dTDP-glucose pyrophosphorylase
MKITMQTDDFKNVVDNNKSILYCLEKLETLKNYKVLFIVDKNRLIGSITDGDIRRWILHGGALNAELSQVAYLNPTVVFKNQTANIDKLFEAYNINAIPLLDENNNLLDIFFKDNKGNNKVTKDFINVPLVIQAGGEGRRLRPLTYVLPKPLIPINDMPMSELIINAFKEQGLSQFFMIINYKKNLIQSYYDEKIKSYLIDFVIEEEPLGTLGSLWYLKEQIKKDFIFTYCDTLIDIDFSDALRQHIENMYDLTIISVIKEDINPYGLLKMDEVGNFDRIIEKPLETNLINSGVYIFNPSVFRLIDSKKSLDFIELVDKLKANEMKIGHYPVPESVWYDFGNPESILTSTKKLNKNRL